MQWTVIDAKVYDLTRFKNLHPGGASVLLEHDVGSYYASINALATAKLTLFAAGQDATDMFFSLHRFEILNKPQYQRLIIGRIEGEESIIYDKKVGETSTVPYGEPTWISKGYHSPYYSEVRPLNVVRIL